MSTRAIVVALACLSVTTAAAQPLRSVDQVAPSKRLAGESLGVSQVQSTPPQDRAVLKQLDRRLGDRGLKGAEPLTATELRAPAEIGELAPARPRSDSVDPEDIARLLATGEASSIDAAASIAAAASKARPVAEDVSERVARARQKQGM